MPKTADSKRCTAHREGVATPVYRSLVEHPNAPVVRDVLTRISQITDSDLTRLAACWRDSLDIASARAAALSVDGPLVLEALAAFDAVSEVFADDLAGEPWAAPLQRSVVQLALKAVRDAIAAAYARPVLHPRQYIALMTPWLTVFPRTGTGEADLGPRSTDVTRLLELLESLSTRCHDPAAAAHFDRLAGVASTRDQDFIAPATAEAWSASVITGRRRTRALLRRAAREALLHGCTVCGRRPDPEQLAASRVLALVSDAIGALLVCDTMDRTLVDVLVLPVADVLARDSA